MRAATAGVVLLALAPALAVAAEPAPPSADFVFTSNRDSNSEIYLLPAGKTEWQNLTNHPDADNWPVWSPDGSRIAFQRLVDGKFDVWVMDADGSNQVRLTDHPDHDYLPSWSSDGTRILFTSRRQEPGDEEPGVHIYVMNSDGSEQRRLIETPLGGSTGAVWSPDGRTLAVPMMGASGRADVFLAAVDGTDLRQLTSDPASEATPAYSPDGRWLAYYSQNDDGSKLTLESLETGERRALQPHTWSWYPRWSIDGEWLTYTGSVRDDDWDDLDLYAVPVAGGEPVLVVGGPDRESEGSWRPTPAAGTAERKRAEPMKSLDKQIWIGAPIEEVWRCWTTEEGLRFISDESKVQLEIGGPYEWFLDLEPDARGKRGGEGAVIHAFLEPEMLAFSWTFPPSIPSLREAGATTRVVVRLSAENGGTRIDFRQRGWQDGEDWQRGYEYFDHGWDLVLNGLKEHLEAGVAKSPATGYAPSAIAAAVGERERAFAATVAAKNPGAFRTFLDPQAVFIGGGSELRGADQVVAAWSGFFQPGGGSLSWEPDRVAVDASGRLAISTGPFRMQSPEGADGAQRLGGRFFSVWQQGDDGVWRVLFDAGTEATPLE